VKSYEFGRRANGEGIFLNCSDIEARRFGYQSGLDTPVVQTDNDEHRELVKKTFSQANAKMFYLKIMIARLKLKEIGGNSFTGGGVLLFNATVHANLNHTLIWNNLLIESTPCGNFASDFGWGNF